MSETYTKTILKDFYGFGNLPLAIEALEAQGFTVVPGKIRQITTDRYVVEGQKLVEADEETQGNTTRIDSEVIKMPAQCLENCKTVNKIFYGLDGAMEVLKKLREEGYQVNHSKSRRLGVNQYMFSCFKKVACSPEDSGKVVFEEGVVVGGNVEAVPEAPNGRSLALAEILDDLTKKAELLAFAESHGFELPEGMIYPAQIKKHLKTVI